MEQTLRFLNLFLLTKNGSLANSRALDSGIACGLCVSAGRIVWAHGPFPCGAHTDVVIFRKGIKLALANGEMVIGDNGYTDEKCITGNDQQLMQQEVFERVKARHETVNRRLKQFYALGHKFRHGLSRHSICFFAVLNLTQLMIDDGAPLFEV